MEEMPITSKNHLSVDTARQKLKVEEIEPDREQFKRLMKGEEEVEEEEETKEGLMSPHELLLQKKIPTETFDAFFTQTIEKTNSIEEISPSSVSSIAQTSLDTLLSEMVKHITLVENNGIQQTTLLLNLPNLNEIEIVFDQYATAPNCFNITLKSDATTTNLFSQNLAGLKASLEQAAKGCKIELLPPELLTYKHKDSPKGEIKKARKKALVKSNLIDYPAN